MDEFGVTFEDAWLDNVDGLRNRCKGLLCHSMKRFGTARNPERLEHLSFNKSQTTPLKMWSI